jgi:glycosyltransferase involved in cell wall biosynthesis
VMRIVYSVADLCFRTTSSMGIYNFSMGLLRALPSRRELSEIYVLANHTLVDELPVADNVRSLVSDFALQSVFGRVAWDQWAMHAAARRAGGDWLFLPKGFSSFLSRPPLRLAAYIHDIIPVIYAERYPSSTNPFRHAYFSAVYKATLRHARVIFTNTEFTKSEIARLAKTLHVRCPPIVVVGYGFDAMPEGRTKKEDQVLVMVRKDPHKRSDLAIQYLSRWQEQTGYTGKLMCVGSLPGRTHLPERPNWQRLERLDHRSLLRTIEKSRVLVHFSEYEGFGMPPVEAVLQGTFPVYSDIPATHEAMGGIGGPFGNGDYESFARAMDDALHVSRTTLGQWGSELIARHSWGKVTDRIVQGLKEHGQGSPIPIP